MLGDGVPIKEAAPALNIPTQSEATLSNTKNKNKFPPNQTKTKHQPNISQATKNIF